jgi:hypothetical protein
LVAIRITGQSKLEEYRAHMRIDHAADDQRPAGDPSFDSAAAISARTFSLPCQLVDLATCSC